MKLTATIASLAIAAALPLQIEDQEVGTTLAECRPICKALFPGLDGLSSEARQQCIIDCLDGGTGGGQQPPPPLKSPPQCTKPADTFC